jgi:hypothetical protein
MNIDWNNLIDNSEKICTIAAVIVGGLWVYFNSFRGRTFIPRLQLEVSGQLLSHGQNQFVLVTMQVKNVGSSIVQLRAKGTGLKVVSLQADDPVLEAANLIERETNGFPVLEKNIIAEKETRSERLTKNIEPGTAVNEQKLIAVSPSQYDAFRLELKVFAYGRTFLGWKAPDSRWTAITVAARHDSLAPPSRVS